jgi:predicted small secreted protein
MQRAVAVPCHARGHALNIDGGTMKKIIALVIGVMFLAGCNTMAGIGEDTQALGKKVENSADRNKHYSP